MAYPAFICMQTLMGGKPDVNKRTIYAYDTDLPVMTFNGDMRPWTPEMEMAVNAELKALNELAGWPRKRLPNGMVLTYGPRRRRG